MNKSELVDAMAKDTGLSKSVALHALNSFMDNVTDALKEKDGKVTLVGFGTFAKIKRQARNGRNPKTGEPIKIDECNVVRFRPGKTLKDTV